MSERHAAGAESPDAVAWAAWSAHLADEVSRLADRASLTVTGPAGSERPVLVRKARLGGFVPAKN